MFPASVYLKADQVLTPSPLGSRIQLGLRRSVFRLRLHFSRPADAANGRNRSGKLLAKILGGDRISDGGTISPGKSAEENISVVAEPATWMLFCLGLLFGTWFRRRQLRRRASDLIHPRASRVLI